jgi:hypothetical protein
VHRHAREIILQFVTYEPVAKRHIWFGFSLLQAVEKVAQVPEAMDAAWCSQVMCDHCFLQFTHPE